MTKHDEATRKIILALDGGWEESAPLIGELARLVGGFQVGIRLLTSMGGLVVGNYIRDQGGRVFLHTRFNETPGLMAEAVQEAVGLGATMFSVDVSAGIDAMKVAVAHKGESLVVAVLGLSALNELGGFQAFKVGLEERLGEVVWRARLAMTAGVDAVICSPAEIQALVADIRLSGLKKYVYWPRLDMTPHEVYFQKIDMTPAQAIQNGADVVIIDQKILSELTLEAGTVVQALKDLARAIKETTV